MTTWYIITVLMTATFGPIHPTTHGPYIGTREDCLRMAKLMETSMIKAECRTDPGNRYTVAR